MSKILRRPMFRGGPVSSYGTGIASGLAEGGRVGYEEGGDVNQEDKTLILQQVITDLGPDATQEDIVTEYNKRTGSGGYKFSETPIAKGIEGLAAYGPNSAIAAGLDMVNVPLNTLGRLFGYNPGFSGAKQMDLLTDGRFSKFTGNDPETARFLGFATDAKTGFTTDSMVSNENIKKQAEEIKNKNLENQNNNKNNNQDGGNLNNFQEKSDKEVMQEYMDMFKETLGGDKDELNRQRYLEIAKFGANLLAQPGGQSLGEAVGKAGAPALEGFSKIEATERLADRQAKSLGFQAALKELEGGTIDKNIKDLQKYMPRDQAIKVATSRGDATKQSTIESRIQYYADVLLKGEGAPKDARVARAIAEKINASGVDFFKFEPFDKATIIEGNYYYDKNGKLYKGTEDGVQELNIT